MSNSRESARVRPRAFRLDSSPLGDGSVEIGRGVTIAPQEDAYACESEALGVDEAAIEHAQRDGMRKGFALGLGGLFWSALSSLLALGIGVAIERWISDLFNDSPAPGAIALGLAAVAALALVALGIREVVGIFRQSQVAKLHAALARAHASDDRSAARIEVRALSQLYRSRLEFGAAREEIGRASGEIIDGRDLVDIAERVFLLPIDARVAREIADAAKRVSVVTAISPRAILDLVFVIAQLVRLIRRIAELYSGRPGFFGFLRLARSVGAHLAVTGGMAVGDSLLQQVVGHGLAAKLSARLGEGVLNGLLTTRVGLSAMAVCRPMPFNIAKQPGVKDVAPFLFGGQEEDAPVRPSQRTF